MTNPPITLYGARRVTNDDGVPMWIHDECGKTTSDVERPGPHSCAWCGHAPSGWLALYAAVKPSAVPRSAADLLRMTSEYATMRERQAILRDRGLMAEADVIGEQAQPLFARIAAEVQRLQGIAAVPTDAELDFENGELRAKVQRLRAERDAARGKLEQGHVCTAACGPNRHVAHLGRHALDEALAEVRRLHDEVTQRDEVIGSLKRRPWMEQKRRELAELERRRDKRDATTTAPQGDYFDENTLAKVYRGLSQANISDVQATDAVNQMQNEGILFRERGPGAARGLR
jgi:hypothetical protein